MKNMRLVVALVALLSFGFALQASAYPTLSEGQNTLFLDGWESGFNSTWQVTYGTIFAGVLKINSMENSNLVETWASPAPGYLSGIFLAQVTGIDAATGKYTLSAVDPTYNPAAWNNLDLSFKNAFGSVVGSAWTLDNPGEVIQLYYQDNPSPLVSSQFTASVVDDIVNKGTPWGSFGMFGDNVSMSTQINLGDFDVNPDGTPVASGVNPFGYFEFDLSRTSNAILLGDTGGWMGESIAAKLNLTRIRDTGDYQVALGNQGEIYATPEPATMVIMGAGLLGLFGLRRRQKNN